MISLPDLQCFKTKKQGEFQENPLLSPKNVKDLIWLEPYVSELEYLMLGQYDQFR